MTWARLFILGCLILSFTSCTCSKKAKESETGKAAPTTPDPNKAPDYSGITVERVIAKDVSSGKGGEVKAGSKVSGYYSMWVYAPAQLANKGKFISGNAEDRKELFTFEVGKGEVVPGWEQGVMGMRAGGKRSIIVPIALGFGEKGNDTVPPGSILLIEFEAVKVN
ncbi:MAG: FKBP-type peptidyl-prolyl cis-trans isomerase [Bdellovibrionaceae bacterium]|nr:FKBP-type peptidyl-prolyl cis-trans isomerase [Pseudobdellovibrionaceae bacterium]